MRKSRFTEEQIRDAMQQAEVGIPVPELCRKYGISEATYYRWLQRYGALTKGELARRTDEISARAAATRLAVACTCFDLRGTHSDFSRSG